jgi:Tfp pilus assembly protein PilE
MKCARTAFTLVELTVVVAVIAALTALVLPAVQSIQASTDRMRCQNNLRQMYTAFQFYCLNNRQMMPNSRRSGASPDFQSAVVDSFHELTVNNGILWSTSRDKAVKSNTVAICPTIVRTYRIKDMYFSGAYGGTAKEMSVQYAHNDTIPGIRPLSWIKTPDKWPLWGDAAVGLWRPDIPGSVSSYVTIPDLVFANPHYGPAAAKGVGLQHRNSGTLVYADGHCDKVVMADLAGGKYVNFFANN